MWVKESFPSYARAGFAPHHVNMWEWVTGIGQSRPRPYVALWPRGGAKSTTAEMAAAFIGIFGVRPYLIYVCATQEDADKHLQSIAALLTSLGVERQVSKYGHSRGWRRNRIVTDNGFTADALGFDTAMRGIKFEEHRPGLIVLDDVDHRHDKPDTIRRKITTLTETILPAGSTDCAVLFVQNVIHRQGIAARLAGLPRSPECSFLLDRIVSGPVPAIEGLKTVVVKQPDGTNRVRIVEGRPVWEGQGLEICEQIIQASGLRSFLRESQHQVWDDSEEHLFSAATMQQYIVDYTPPGTAQRVLWWDEADGVSEGADFTVGQLMSRTPADVYYTEAVYRVKMQPAERDAYMSEVMNSVRRMHPDCRFYRGRRSHEADSISNARDRVFADFGLRSIRESVSKVLRAEPVAAAIAAGRWRIVRGNWNQSFIDEHDDFPDGLHDDIVDTTSGCYNQLQSISSQAYRVIA